MRRRCLAALAALADENRLGERDAAFAARLLGCVRDRARLVGAAWETRTASARADPNEECRDVLNGPVGKIPPDPGLGGAADLWAPSGGSAARAAESAPPATAARRAGDRNGKGPGAR